jgi:transcriptional regulator with XRE-family HTH domain
MSPMARKIRSYVKVNKLTIEGFAHKAGISNSLIWSLLNGDRHAGNDETKRKLIFATEGLIIPADFLPGLKTGKRREKGQVQKQR